MLAEQEFLRVDPRRHGALRLCTFWLAERATRLLGGRSFYRRAFLGPGRLQVREERVPVESLPVPLHGFCVVQLSDFHAGALFSRGSLAHAVQAANAVRPDLIVLTGDCITRHWSEALLLLDDLARLRARLGVFAVFGNHDYRGRCEGRIDEAFAARGIQFLRNRGVRFEVGGAGICVCGVEDLEEARAIDLASARRLVQDGDVEIVLCHNPQRGVELARSGAAAILCGHTHGTQIDAPWLRRLGPPHPGARVHLGGTRLITSRGLGVIGLPLRIGAPAEIVVVRLENRTEGVRACTAV